MLTPESPAGRPSGRERSARSLELGHLMTRSDTGPTLAASAAAARSSISILEGPVVARSDDFIPARSAPPSADAEPMGEVGFAPSPPSSPWRSSFYNSLTMTRRPSLETPDALSVYADADPTPHEEGPMSDGKGPGGGEAVGYGASVGTASDGFTSLAGPSRRGQGVTRAVPLLSSSLALRPFWLRFENTDVEAWCVLRPFLARPSLIFAVTCFSVPCTPSSDQENLPWH